MLHVVFMPLAHEEGAKTTFPLPMLSHTCFTIHFSKIFCFVCTSVSFVPQCLLIVCVQHAYTFRMVYMVTATNKS